jgi:hypothetical protein
MRIVAAPFIYRWRRLANNKDSNIDLEKETKKSPKDMTIPKQFRLEQLQVGKAQIKRYLMGLNNH